MIKLVRTEFKEKQKLSKSRRNQFQRQSSRVVSQEMDTIIAKKEEEHEKRKTKVMDLKKEHFKFYRPLYGDLRKKTYL